MTQPLLPTEGGNRIFESYKHPWEEPYDEPNELALSDNEDGSSKYPAAVLDGSHLDKTHRAYIASLSTKKRKSAKKPSAPQESASKGGLSDEQVRFIICLKNHGMESGVGFRDIAKCLNSEFGITGVTTKKVMTVYKDVVQDNPFLEYENRLKKSIELEAEPELGDKNLEEIKRWKKWLEIEAE